MPGDTTDSSMRLSRVEAEEADGRASDSVQESARPKLRQDRSPVSYDSQLPPTNSGPDSTRSARPLLATVLVLYCVEAFSLLPTSSVCQIWQCWLWPLVETTVNYHWYVVLLLYSYGPRLNGRLLISPSRATTGRVAKLRRLGWLATNQRARRPDVVWASQSKCRLGASAGPRGQSLKPLRSG
jgi:hypothetical protein